MATTTVPTRLPVTAADLAGDARRRSKERLIKGVFLSAAALSIAVSVGILVSVVGNAIHFLTLVRPAQLMQIDWTPRAGQFGFATLLAGTMIVTVIAMFVAMPLGMGAAMYLAEYARPRARRVLKPIVEVLAGIPSVVLGYFALNVISPEFVQRLF